MNNAGSTARAAVASGHPLVSEAACELLRAGGNAFDAAVAGGFAAAVAEPALTSLGGGGFLLARNARGEATLFDFFVDTPGRGLQSADLEPHFIPVTVRFPGCEQIFNVGLGSVAVPGNLSGFLHVHRRLGRAPLSDVLAPAVRLARGGVVLNHQHAYFLQLLEPIMTLTPGARALYAPRGQLLKSGERLYNPELADFLHSLGTNGDGETLFYKGAVADQIAADMQHNQGLLSKEDLMSYQVIEREPLNIRYRDHTLLTNTRPSFGGALIALSLQLLEAAATPLPRFGSARHLCLLAAVMGETSRNREAYLRDTLSQSALASGFERMRFAARGTTHLSICDTEGNAASMTTSNGEGSGYIAPGTGIMLNNMMGEDDLHPDGFHSSPPGIRVSSMMAPSILIKNNQVELVLGSGGSKRIRTAILQLISNVVDHHLALDEAVTAPRLHWDGEHIQLEPGFEQACVDVLKRDWPVNQWQVQDLYFGGVHSVAPLAPTRAAGDPRRGGHAIVL